MSVYSLTCTLEIWCKHRPHCSSRTVKVSLNPICKVFNRCGKERELSLRGIHIGIRLRSPVENVVLERDVIEFTRQRVHLYVLIDEGFAIAAASRLLDLVGVIVDCETLTTICQIVTKAELYGNWRLDGNSHVFLNHPLTMIFKFVNGCYSDGLLDTINSPNAFYVPCLAHSSLRLEFRRVTGSVTRNFTLNVAMASGS